MSSIPSSDMSRSTKDDLLFSKEEFILLRAIIKTIPDFDTAAALDTAHASYVEYSATHQLDDDNGACWQALLRLARLSGDSWASKLINAAKACTLTEYIPPDRGHKRQDSADDFWTQHRDVSARSVVQQKLEKAAQVSRIDSTKAHRGKLSTQAAIVVARERAPTLEEQHELATRCQEFLRLQGVKRCARAFRQWQYATHMIQISHDNAWAIAVRLDHDLLTRQAFELWNGVLHSQLEQHRYVQGFVTGVVVKKYLRIWQDRIIQRREGEHQAKKMAECRARIEVFRNAMQRKLVRKHLRLWRFCLRKLHKSSTMAALSCVRHRRIACIRIWYLETCERRAVTLHDRRAQMAAWRYWSARRKYIQVLDYRATEKFEEALISSAMDNWRASYSENDVRLEEACQMHETALLQRSRDRWRTELKMILMQERIQILINTRISQCSFRIWAERARLQQANRRSVNRARLGKLFSAWQRESQTALLAVGSQHRMRRQVFRQWLVQARIQISLYQISRRQARSALRTWRGRYKLRESREWRITRDTQRHTRSKAFCHWRALLQHVQSRNKDADNAFTRSSASTVLFKLYEGHEIRCSLNTKAVKSGEQSIVKKAFVKWLQIHLVKRAEAMEQTLTFMVQERAAKLSRDHLDRWSEAKQQQRIHVDSADALFKARQLVEVRAFFVQWQERHVDQFESHCTVVDLLRASAANFIWKAIRERKHATQELSEIADRFYNEKMHKVGRDELRHWRSVNRHNLDKSEEVEFRLKRWNKKLLAYSLRIWQERAGNALDAKGRTLIGDYSSDSFDASRTRIQWHNDRAETSSRTFRIFD